MAVQVRLLLRLGLALVLATACGVRGQKFTTVEEATGLYRRQQDVAEHLERYVRDQQRRLAKLSQLASDMMSQSALFMERLDNWTADEASHTNSKDSDAEEGGGQSNRTLEELEYRYSNPLSAFLLVKHFSVDWDRILTEDVAPAAPEAFLEELRLAAGFPNLEDFRDAASGLLTLQETYKLGTASIAGAEIPGADPDKHLSADDCFELGRVAYDGADYYNAINWMEEAHERVAKETVPSVEPALLLDYLAYAYFLRGNLPRAYNLTLELLEADPTSSRRANIALYESEIEAARRENAPTVNETWHNTPMAKEGWRGTEDFAAYQRLCRGEQSPTAMKPTDQVCRFRTSALDPIFTLSPLREEVLHVDPFIAVYHDVITETEIATVRHLALPKLDISGVFRLKEDTAPKIRLPKGRSSKTAWLHDADSHVIQRLSRKAAALSDLTLTSAEPFQIVRYGIGGFYETHVDFSRDVEESTFSDEIGNRIATAIFYMNTPLYGGYTVFPKLGVAVAPERGSCVLWYNLRKDGSGDDSTAHAGCPVLAGGKWICNKWFHERGQEFARPCGTCTNKVNEF